MALEQINGKVLKLTEIPEELTEEHWISDHYPDAYVMVHISEDEDEQDEVDKWIREHYPELVDEDYFFIHIDY